MKLDTNPLLSIIIVNWNAKEYLLGCLKSIFDRKLSFIFEVIVVDNCSSDGSPEMVEVSFPSVKLIKSSVNLGFAGGNDLAVKLAGGRYCLFINPDVIVLDDCIEVVLSKIRACNIIGAIGCQVLNENGTIQKTCARYFPTVKRKFLDHVLLHNYWPERFRGLGEYYRFIHYSNDMEVECLSGCFMLVPNVILKELGGFSTKYFMYAEDIDLCLRLRLAGYTVYYTSAAKIIHYGAKSSVKQKNPYFAVVQKYESDVQFFHARYGYFSSLILRTIILIGSLIRLAGSVMSLCISKGQMTLSSFHKHIAVIRWASGLTSMKK